MLSGETANTII